jgi:Ca2+/Na+ antiporter
LQSAFEHFRCSLTLCYTLRHSLRYTLCILHIFTVHFISPLHFTSIIHLTGVLFLFLFFLFLFFFLFEEEDNDEEESSRCSERCER